MICKLVYRREKVHKYYIEENRIYFLFLYACTNMLCELPYGYLIIRSILRNLTACMSVER
jgi:hypothetical protein